MFLECSQSVSEVMLRILPRLPEILGGYFFFYPEDMPGHHCDWDERKYVLKIHLHSQQRTPLKRRKFQPVATGWTFDCNATAISAPLSLGWQRSTSWLPDLNFPCIAWHWHQHSSDNTARQSRKLRAHLTAKTKIRKRVTFQLDHLRRWPWHSGLSWLKLP